MDGSCWTAGIRAVLGGAANEEIMNLAHLDCARAEMLMTIPNGYEAGGIKTSAREKSHDIERDNRPRAL